MVQFPRFRLTAPYGPRCRAFDSSTGYPIRPSTDLRMFAPTRGFSQLTTAFLAKQLQGIHRRPLPACHITHLPFPVSDDRCKDPVDQRRRRRRAGVRSQHTFVKDPSSQKTRKRVPLRRPSSSSRFRALLPEILPQVCANVEVWGLEPQTYGLQSHRSGHLSYTPGDRCRPAGVGDLPRVRQTGPRSAPAAAATAIRSASVTTKRE